MEHLCHDPPAEESVVGNGTLCHDAAEYRVVVIQDGKFPVFVGGDILAASAPAWRTGSSRPHRHRGVPRYAPRPFGKSGGRIMAGHHRIDGAQIRILADNGARGGKFLVRDGEFRAASGAQDFVSCFFLLIVNLLIVDYFRVPPIF